MNSFVGSSLGRILVIHLKPGDLLLESIEGELAAQGFKNAVVLSCAATLDIVSCHRVKDTEVKPTNVFFKETGPFEVSSLQGMVIDGRPHFHITVSDGQRTFGAHLEHGSRVLYVAEIVLGEIAGLDHLQRTADENGIPRIITLNKD